MKQLQYNEYGTPEVLHWAEIALPTPKADEVLVRVKAASLNPTDSKIRQGNLKMMTAMKHFPMGMGLDFAGIVTAVGADVTHLKIGDEVMGVVQGSGGYGFADYTVAAAKNVYLKPAQYTFAEACCLPMNATAACVVVNDYLHPAPGMDILINGGSGGIGLFVVQLCKAKGAKVSATCSAEAADAVKALGADEVIDYRTTDVYAAGKLYDAILDAAGVMHFAQAQAILKAHGEYCTLTPNMETIVGQVGSLFGNKKEKNVFAIGGPKEMQEVLASAQAGQLKPVVGKTYPLSEAKDALAQFENGKIKVAGKVVLVAMP